MSHFLLKSQRAVLVGHQTRSFRPLKSIGSADRSLSSATTTIHQENLRGRDANRSSYVSATVTATTKTKVAVIKKDSTERYGRQKNIRRASFVVFVWGGNVYRVRLHLQAPSLGGRRDLYHRRHRPNGRRHLLLRQRLYFEGRRRISQLCPEDIPGDWLHDIGGLGIADHGFRAAACESISTPVGTVSRYEEGGDSDASAREWQVGAENSRIDAPCCTYIRYYCMYVLYSHVAWSCPCICQVPGTRYVPAVFFSGFLPQEPLFCLLGILF